jgi:hypothetical protein
MTITERNKGIATREQGRAQVIVLTNNGGNVIVTPDDEDRFVLTAQSAVKACQDHVQQNESIKKFKSEFIRPLMDWCESNAGRIHSTYIPIPIGYVQVFVVGNSERFDFALGEDLANLELQLADAGWRVSILQIPLSSEEELKTYFDPDGALLIYAQLEATQRQGGAQ